MAGLLIAAETEAHVAPIRAFASMTLNGVRVSLFVLVFIVFGTAAFGFRFASMVLVGPNAPTP